MFKRTEPQALGLSIQFPHCDPRILHAPGECKFCDMHPEWQHLRQVWKIAFTGFTPDAGELPCPADNARGDKHSLWPNNRAVNEAS